jgi:two-component SAPR family response regulator
MTSFSAKVIGCVTLLFLCGWDSLRAINDPALRRYDECIFVISNYSGVDATQPENSSVRELLERKIDGFRFNIEWEKTHNRLILKDAFGKKLALVDILREIRESLEKNPDQILTLFLDFNVNVNELTREFEESGLISFVYRYEILSGWPSLKSMRTDNRRLLVFSMQEHRTSPEWLHYIWNFAVEPYFSLMEAPDFIGEFLKGDPKNDLLIYNDYNLPGPGDENRIKNFDLNQNPYLIEHIKNVWSKTGKTPNFIMLDKYRPEINRVVSYLNMFKTIKGTVTYNTQVLNYVSWEGRNSLTSGKFCFPIGPGDNVTLVPKSPGYRFKPQSIAFGELRLNKEQHFMAYPMELSENLEAFYNFENNFRDITGHGNHGNSVGVALMHDSTRNQVAGFNGKSHVVLPKAEAFKIRDHDFTVAAWIRIAKFIPGKLDYCIIGTPTNSYQEGIHLLIRKQKPYFGFYSNDLEGITQIEPGRWYHIVWRYTKLSGEQAIFINGKPDSRSLGHPSYKGREKLYIGVAGFSWSSNMVGAIDDLAIWSRSLGNEEIWAISKDIQDIIKARSFIIRHSMILAVVAVLIIFMGGFYFLRSARRKKSNFTPHRVESGLPDKREIRRNCIQLFGDFRIVDRNGRDISHLFTPKLKQLFLIILIHSHAGKRGISTKELTSLLWPDYSYQNAKNIRGVTVRKLRLLLKLMDEVSIVFHLDTWTIYISDNVYCDYLECLRLFDRPDTNRKGFYEDLFRIVKKGEVFLGESHDWLDESKDYIANNIVDHLIKYIRELNADADLNLILKLADRILLADPVNEQALAFQLRSLMKKNNHKLARFSYEKFLNTYQEMYGEKFKISFEELIG